MDQEESDETDPERGREVPEEEPQHVKEEGEESWSERDRPRKTQIVENEAATERDLLHNFLITGATDGIGLETALRLAAVAPHEEDEDSKRMVIGIHGRDHARIDQAIKKIKEAHVDRKYVIKKFCYDLSDHE